MSHKIQITVDAPVDPVKQGQGYRQSVMLLHIESELPVAMIQQHVNNLFTELTNAALENKITNK
jgi:hypothetical protein